MRFAVSLLFALVVALLPGSGQAAPAGPETLNLDILGQIGGQVVGATLQGTWAYIGVGPRLVVVDIADANAPTILGQSEPEARFVLPKAAVGRNVYALTGNQYGRGDELVVYDVGDPARPIAVGRYDPAGSGHTAVLVASGRAYLAVPFTSEQAGVLEVVDLADPARPILLGSLPMPIFEGELTLALVGGRWLYVTVNCPTGRCLRIVDVVDPRRPVEGGLFVPSLEPSAGYGYISGVQVVGQYGYAQGGANLRVLDLSDPARPMEVAAVRPIASFAAERVRAAAGGLVVWGIHTGFHVLDLADPRSPRLVARLDGLGDLLAAESARAIVSDLNTQGIERGPTRVLDLTDPASPRAAGQYPGVTVGAVSIADGRAYIYDRHRLDVVDPLAPIERALVGSLAFEGRLALAVNGTTAYVAVADGVRAIDVSAPAGPRAIGSYAASAPVSLAASGGLLLVGGERQIDVVDVADPTLPMRLSTVAARVGQIGIGPVSQLALVGRQARVLEGLGGLRVLDLTDPSKPVELGFYDPPPEPRRASWNQYLAARLGDRVLLNVYGYDGHGVSVREWHLVDMTQPSGPTLVSRQVARPWIVPAAEGGSFFAGAVTFTEPGAPDGRRYVGQVLSAADPTCPRVTAGLVAARDDLGAGAYWLPGGDVSYLVGPGGIWMLGVRPIPTPAAGRFRTLLPIGEQRGVGALCWQ